MIRTRVDRAFGRARRRGDEGQAGLFRAAAHEVAPSLKPKLYIVTIGVSDYVDPTCVWLRRRRRARLRRGDARAGGRALQRGEVLPPLIDRAVTRASVISALRWLRKQVTERDIGMVLIAGHGATDDGQNYWFLPSDATRDNLDANGVSQDDLLREMRQVAGKTILFLDTCHSNQAVRRRNRPPRSDRHRRRDQRVLQGGERPGGVLVLARARDLAGNRRPGATGRSPRR